MLQGAAETVTARVDTRSLSKSLLDLPETRPAWTAQVWTRRQDQKKQTISCH